jgi:hypothetical protein
LYKASADRLRRPPLQQTHTLFPLKSFRQWVALYGTSWVEEFQEKFARHVLRARAKRVSHHQFSQIRGRQPYLFVRMISYLILLLAVLVAFNHHQFSQIQGRQPSLFVRKIFYVIHALHSPLPATLDGRGRWR